MPLHFSLRIGALGATALIALSTQGNDVLWRTIVFTLGICHYALALVYSQKQINQVLKQSYSLLPLAAIICMGTLFYKYPLPLVIFFGVHHAFNEIYLLDRTVPGQDPLKLKTLRTTGVLFHLLAYLFILRNHVDLSHYPAQVFGGLTLVCLIAFAVLFMKLYPGLKPQEIINNCAGEIATVFLIGVSLFIKLTFLQVVLYHFLFWMIYPLPNLIKHNKPQFHRYLSVTILMHALIFAISPLGLVGYEIHGSVFSSQFYIWSYLHITLSLALSDANPQWIANWFQPRAIRPAVVHR